MSLRRPLLQAAYDGDLRSFNSHGRALDKGRGRLRDAVEAVAVEGDGELKGVRALHLAAGSRRLEMCAYLVEVLRVDMDAVDNGGRTPLLYAMYGEKVDTFKYLLDHGANQDKVDPHGFAPLHSPAGSDDGAQEMEYAGDDYYTTAGAYYYVESTDAQE